MQESNKLITFSALRLPDDVHHLFLLPLGSHLIRIQPELRWPHQPATGAASAAALLAAYSPVATAVSIATSGGAAFAELTGYTTAMTAAQTISLGGTCAAHVNRWVSMGRVHCAIFRTYRTGIHINSPENVSANF